MKQREKTMRIGSILLAGLALACSGEPGLEGGKLATPSDVLAPGEADGEVDVEALMRAEVTDEEMLVLEDYFERSSTGTPTSMTGRLLHWEDAMMTVDDVLWRAARMDDPNLIEKGFAQTNAANPNNSTSIQFFRPDIFKYYVIVENDVPSSVFTAVGNIFSQWAGLSVDCVGVSSFEVIRRTAYNALSQNQRDITYDIQFQYITKTTPGWPCATGQDACANFPTVQSVKIGTSFTTRMAFGSRISVDSVSAPSSNIPVFEKILRHEIGHTLGFDHQTPLTQTTSAHHIPGTQSCGATSCSSPYPSVMRTGSSTATSFQTDDEKSMRTLYADAANRANDECAYVDGFRVLAQLP